MDCWIASFPRSGNTYIRNILYYVYGIESSTWHKESSYPVDENYDTFRFVKTHLLPEDLIPDDPSIPAIYLVRDGRDAVVSIAHHRRDLVVPGSDFQLNLQEAIVAAEGSFFGGWSRNVSAWLQRAQLVIRYEDLISDPVATFDRIGKLISLPSPNWEKLPGFEEMKKGKPKYGGTSKLIDPKFNADDFAGKFFRKGKSGAWKEDMPSQAQDLFWNYHGDMMERLGYATHNGSVEQNLLLDYCAMKKMGKDVPPEGNEKISVCIEASKLTQPVNDGIKRYLLHLLKKFEDVTKNGDPRWEFKLLVNRKFYPLETYKAVVSTEEILTYEKVLLGFKKIVQYVLPARIYNTVSGFYRNTDIRVVLKMIQQKAYIKQKKTIYQKLVSVKDVVNLIHVPLPQNIENYKSLQHTYLVTVHDLTHKLFPQYHEKDNIALSESGMEFILNNNADVIAVSQNTMKDISLNYSIPAEKIHMVYESPDRDLFRWNVNSNLAEKIREKYQLGPSLYFLCLSTIEPRKNLPNTIRAFNLFVEENPGADINLVISGNFGWKTEHLSNELHLDNRKIIFTGYIEDHDLHVIYSEAVALCYISFYEGFGLPPLEAMSCRTPVIYGNNSSMIEVIGDAGLPANANDVKNIKEQMYRMYSDKVLREKLAVRSHHRSFEFSWRKSIYETLKVYEEIVGKSV